MSLRAGTFFEKTKIPLQKFLILIYWWVREYPVTQAARESEVAKGTAIDVYQWLREICSWRLINHEDLRLGGSTSVTTNIVEIDESCFSLKPKVQTSLIQKCLPKLLYCSLPYFSIIVGTHHDLRYGCLVWLIPATHPTWVTWRWYSAEMQLPSCPLFSSTPNLEQRSRVTSGQRITLYPPYLTCPHTEQ